ncbi:MAG: purine-nucleoside phosphorylase [Clostridia bacterium]|jgi:purine-nucleoside phosphorylase|nr:purine-nucleoside phosphorylase [Clostridia bacterium]
MHNVSPSTCIELKEGTHVAKTVLMPGDPLRAKYVAEHYLENPVLFNDVRNMFGYTGVYEGREISVMGSGMGMPSFTLYAYELFHFFDVEAIIRIGSAGGLSEDTHLRDLIIAMSASTNSSMATAYGLPGIMAPTASFDLLQEAVRAADELGIKRKVGTVYTSDFFYHPDPEVNQRAKSLGHLAVEMEAAGLYLTAMAAHKKALALFQISDHIFTGEALSAAERQDGFREMMEVALRAASRATL